MFLSRALRAWFSAVPSSFRLGVYILADFLRPLRTFVAFGVGSSSLLHLQLSSSVVVKLFTIGLEKTSTNSISIRIRPPGFASRPIPSSRIWRGLHSRVYSSSWRPAPANIVLAEIPRRATRTFRSPGLRYLSRFPASRTAVHAVLAREEIPAAAQRGCRR